MDNQCHFHQIRLLSQTRSQDLKQNCLQSKVKDKDRWHGCDNSEIIPDYKSIKNSKCSEISADSVLRRYIKYPFDHHTSRKNKLTVGIEQKKTIKPKISKRWF